MLRNVRPLRHADPPIEFTSTSERTRDGMSWASLMATPPPNECPTSTAGSSISNASSRSATHFAYPLSENASPARSPLPPKPGIDGAITMQPCSAISSITLR